jgi:DNA gyrase/topoisomerase IV subunit B
LVWEIVDNAVDEALAGYCDDIEIIIESNNAITVKDDGREFPSINMKKQEDLRLKRFLLLFMLVENLEERVIRYLEGYMELVQLL